MDSYFEKGRNRNMSCGIKPLYLVKGNRIADNVKGVSKKLRKIKEEALLKINYRTGSLT